MKLAFYIFVGYAFLGFMYYPSEYSFFSLCLILVYSLPLFIAGNLTKDNVYSKYSKVKPLIYWSIIILGFVNLGIIAKSTGATFLDIFSLDGMKEIAVQSTGIRYEEDTSANSGNPILLALTLWLIFRVGTSSKLTKSYFQIIAFLPLLLYTLITTEKWPSFLGIMFFITGIILSNEKKEYRKILRSKIKYGIIILFLMILSISFRGFDGNTTEQMKIVFHYVLAQYNSLGYWYLEMNNLDLSFGKMTFIGPLNFFNLADRNAGVFNETLMLNGKESNIYTAFRYLIQDFGVLGPFFINLIISFFFVKTFTTGEYRLSNITKGLMIFTAILSMNTTPFVHNSVMFGIVLCLLSDFNTEKDLTKKVKI